MIRILLLTCVLMLNSYKSFSQSVIDTFSIRKQLDLILERDQKTRTVKDTMAFMRYIDSTNLVQIESLIAKYGWMGRSFVGDRGNSAQFFVIQHSNLSTQLKYVSLL